MAKVPWRPEVPQTDALITMPVFGTRPPGSSFPTYLNDTSLYASYSDWMDLGSSGSGRRPPSPPPPTPPKAPKPAPEPPQAADPLPEVPVTGTRPVAPPTPSQAAVPQLGLNYLLPPVGARPRPRPAPRPKPRPRRSKPAPKPSRRPRPTTRPAPRGPRIPLAPLARALLGRLGVVAALVPLYLKTAAKLDSFGTEGWYERIYGVPLDSDRERRGQPRESAPRVPRTESSLPGLSARQLPEQPLETVFVTGRAPLDVPFAAPLFQPVGGLGVGQPFQAEPRPEAAPQPRRRPINVPAPAPNPSPFPGLELAPEPAPAPAPERYAPPVPRPDIIAMPGPGLQPSSPLNPAITPQLQPQPAARADPCDCGGKGKSKKKRKQPKDRDICYRGTFVEKPRGISKRRRERVDCKTGKPLKPPAAANEEF